MFAGLPVASLPLSKLLDGSATFAIPAFQRPYEWGVEEANQLLDDIVRASGIDGDEQADSDYFLGMMLLLCPAGAPLPGQDSGEVSGAPAEPYQIIDGQQRLLTLTILFAVLRDLAGDSAEAAELAQRIAIPASPGGEQMLQMPRYRLGLNQRERTFFQRQIQRLGACRHDAERDEAPTDACERIAEVRDAFTASLSSLSIDAGRRLAAFLQKRCHLVVMLSHDIDRAHLMFTVMNERGKPLERKDIIKAGIFSELATDDPAVTRKWDEAAELLGPHMEEFFSHLKLAHGRTEPRIVSGIRNLIAESGGSIPFLNDVMLPYSHIHAGILAAASAELTSVAYAPHLVYLNRLNGSEWKPAVMLAFRKYASEPEILTRIIAEIDRTSHMQRVLCHGGGKRTTRFQAIIRAIEAGVAAKPEADVFRFTREENKVAAYNLRDLHDRNPLISKLLLMRVNDLIEGRIRRVDPADFSVEHVLPQRPPGNSDWRTVFPDSEVRQRATECLGNLTLVSRRLNQKARNSEFDVKRGILEAALTPETDLAITRDVVSATAWNLDAIVSRDERLLEVAGSMLGIDVTDSTLAVELRRRVDGGA